MGIVKSAHREFPMKFLESWANGNEGGLPSRGDHVLLESADDHGSHFYAIGWAKFLVTNAGTTNEVDPSVRVRHRLTVEDGHITTMSVDVIVKRPHAVKHFFEYFSIIDVHDHLRQGSLEISFKIMPH